MFDIPYPSGYVRLLRWLQLLELNFIDLVPFGCLVSWNFHVSLVVRTLILPVISCSMYLVRMYRVRKHEARSKREALDAGSVRHNASLPASASPTRPLDLLLANTETVAFFLLFLLYPSVSAKIFATFQCDDFDDGNRWLRLDYSINCDSPMHIIMTIYAVIMLVYPFGTPTLYYFLLRKHRTQLDKLKASQNLRIKLLEETLAELDFVSKAYDLNTLERSFPASLSYSPYDSRSSHSLWPPSCSHLAD